MEHGSGFGGRIPGLALSLAAALLAVGIGPVAAEDLDGRAIAERADKQNRAKDEKVTLSMVIVSPRGERRTRGLTTYLKAGEGDDDKILIRFESPPDVKGTGLLTVEHGEKDEQWLFLPELRKSKRIAGASKSQSFMGTDFSNYDMRTEDLKGHLYERIRDEKLAGRDCHVIEALPKNEDVLEETGYSRRLIWVDKERFTIPRVEYYDRNKKLLKVLVAEDWERIEGLWRSNRVVMENMQEGSKTIVTYDRGREINKGIDDRVFTRRELERP